jgi:STIP1 family protein 1
LTKEKKVNYGDDITSQLRRARRLKWEKQEEVRQNQEIELLVIDIFWKYIIIYPIS